MLPLIQAIGCCQHKMDAIKHVREFESPNGRGEKLAGNYLVHHHYHQGDDQPGYT
jgi:hypothetical protein